MANRRFAFAAAASTTAFALSASSDFSFSGKSFSDHLKEIMEDINGSYRFFFRSISALTTVTYNIIDYKRSLHGLHHDSLEYAVKLSEVHTRAGRRIYRLCENNRGFYVKAGQFVAAIRQIPREYTSALSSLHDKVAPCDFRDIKDVLMQNLGPDLSDIFLMFEEKPIAAASISQVHRAVLRDHSEVAVKVQYPGLERQMKLDLSIMSFLSKYASWFFPEYRFDWLLSQFKDVISLELDFVHEGNNSERMAKNFKNNANIKIPSIYWDMTTKEVLTMQYCRGYMVDDLQNTGIDKIKVANVLIEVFAEMTFVHGFIHGDPHPGNILVSPGGRNGFSIVLLDHGICTQLSEEFRLDYCELWKALIALDVHRIKQLGERFGAGKHSIYFPLMFTGRTIESKLGLGNGMSLEEKSKLKKQLKYVGIGDFMSIMESVPSDFLTIIRIDALLKSMVSILGITQKSRLLIYAKYAVHGLFFKPSTNPGGITREAARRCRRNMSYLHLRLLLKLWEVISWIRELKKLYYHHESILSFLV